jgi:hypothetical protein
MRTTPLLAAMNISQISKIADINCLKLYRSTMVNSSRSAHFYSHVLLRCKGHNTLLDRAENICNSHHFNFSRYLVDDDYPKYCVGQLKAPVLENGLIDSCKMLLQNYSPADKRLLVLLLMPRF